MKILLIYTGLVVFLLFIPVHTEGQTLEGNIDIYERMNVLRAKLSEWNIDPPLLVEDTVFSFIDFERVFEGYEIDTKILSPDLMRYDVRLPLYLGVLSTNLNFHVKYNAGKRPVVKYISGLLQSDEGIVFDDSSLILVRSNARIKDSVEEIIGNRLHLYRTLGLPKIFRPVPQSVNAPVTLYFHGRDVDSLRYDSMVEWIKTMRQLSFGMLVYAGPVSTELEGESVMLSFYITLTTEEAYGHHYFLVEERLKFSHNHLAIDKITVHFYPYVRVDNLLSLYSNYSYGNNNHERIPAIIKRR